MQLVWCIYNTALTVFRKLLPNTVIKDSINRNAYSRLHDSFTLTAWHWLLVLCQGPSLNPSSSLCFVSSSTSWLDLQQKQVGSDSPSLSGSALSSIYRSFRKVSLSCRDYQKRNSCKSTIFWIYATLGQFLPHPWPPFFIVYLREQHLRRSSSPMSFLHGVNES